MCLSRDAWRQLVLSSLGETDFEWGHTGMSARSGRCVVQEWKPPYPTFQKLYLTHGFLSRKRSLYTSPFGALARAT
uniref:Uncharacterized protein n=1 Tax=Meloidogyne enterolobii TaxID=390850 RepID=A0A6V7VSC7_MELEN|nr:unnamed protein product [Meloidogyne enterolobii]